MARPVIDRARGYALRLISICPRSEEELKQRLRDKGYTEAVITAVTNGCKDEGLIDDRRFAQLWVRRRSQASPRGLQYIRMELLRKHIDKEIINEAIAQIERDFDEEEIARQLIKKRQSVLKGLSLQKKKARLFGYLKRRGFSGEVVYKLLDEAYRDKG